MYDLVDDQTMLSEILSHIRANQSDHPLLNMYNELNEINDYTSRHHHADGTIIPIINQTELWAMLQEPLDWLALVDVYFKFGKNEPCKNEGLRQNPFSKSEKMILYNSDSLGDYFDKYSKNTFNVGCIYFCTQVDNCRIKLSSKKCVA